MKPFVRFLLLAVFVGVFTRLFFPHYFSLNFDELIQYDILSTIGTSSGVFEYLKEHERQGPLTYFLYLPLVNAFPGNIWVLRAMSMGTGLLSLFFFYQLASFLFQRLGDKKDYNERLLVSCALFGLSFLPLSFHYSMRPYGVLLLFTLLSTYFFCRLFAAKDFLWRDFFAFVGSLLFLVMSHPFGLLHGALLLIIALGIVVKKLELSNKSPFLFNGLIGFTILLGILVVSFIFEYRPLGFHPLHWPPSYEKLGAALVALCGGHFNVVLLLMLFWLVHISRKKISGFFLQYFFLFVLLAPVLGAFVISRLYYPIFEYRFFGHLAPFYCLLVPCYLFSAFPKQRVIRHLLTMTVLGSTFFYTFYSQSILTEGSRLSFSEVFKVAPDLKKRVVLSCGNCPSFYFDQDKIQCLRGWNFELPTHKNPEKTASALLVFKKNQFFCRTQVPEGWQQMELPELSIYLKP